MAAAKSAFVCGTRCRAVYAHAAILDPQMPPAEQQIDTSSRNTGSFPIPRPLHRPLFGQTPSSWSSSRVSDQDDRVDHAD